MDLHQIEIFCTLVKLRSFSKTAKALLLTQPTVSGHIKNLEQELSVKIIDRLGKHAVPTEAGEILFRHGQKLLASRDNARQEIAAISGKVTGRLKIGGSTIPGAYILPPLIATFKKKYPSTSIHLFIDDTASVASAVRNSELSMGIVGARISETHLESYSFLKDELVVAVAPEHPWARRRIVPTDALCGEPFILREEGSGTRRIMEEHLEKAGLSTSDLNMVAVMGSSDAVKQAVKAGLGISILSIRALRDDIQSGQVAVLRLKDNPIERSFSVILLRKKSRSPLCQCFLDFLLNNK
jgi:DNA-binding transcriptional LysR family regulator